MTSPTELWEAMKSYGTGVIKGNSADTLGAPVDLINAAISPVTKPLGLYSEDPHFGSKSFRRLLNQSVEDANAAETAGSMLSIGGPLKLAASQAAVGGGVTKAMIVGAMRLQEKNGSVDTALAKEIMHEGQSNATMFNASGVFKDKGELKSVISDAAAKVPMEAALDLRFGGKYGGYGDVVSPMKIEDLIQHPELFSLYPELKDIKVYGDKNLPKGTLGKYYGSQKEMAIHPDVSVDQIKSIALHELQHGIQKIEGWQAGGTPQQFIPFSSSLVQDRINAARKSGDPGLMEAAERFKEIANKKVLEGSMRYENLAGEQEARFTQATKDLPLGELTTRLLKMLRQGDTPTNFDTQPIRPIP